MFVLILKIIFKNKKNIILMYFIMKNISKNNHNHTSKQILKKKKKTEMYNSIIHYIIVRDFHNIWLVLDQEKGSHILDVKFKPYSKYFVLVQTSWNSCMKIENSNWNCTIHRRIKPFSCCWNLQKSLVIQKFDAIKLNTFTQIKDLRFLSTGSFPLSKNTATC